MRPLPALRLGARTRPTLPRRLPKPSTSPGYATLAPARPSLARPPRLALHPSLFLVHLGGITATSCLIPVIGARSSISQAGEATTEEQQQEEPAVPPVPFDYPVQQPFPLKYQLFLLSNNLRRQIAATPVDAAFTLRQLHLVNQVPQLHLPNQKRPHPPSHDLANFAPERWVWRIPAAAALHSILRILSDPSSSSDPRLSDTLLPIAVTIAQHSLRFDSLVWSTVLQARGHGDSLDWERLMAKEKQELEGDGLAEEPVAMTKLRKRSRERSSAPSAEAWDEGYRRVVGMARWTMPEVDGKKVPGQARVVAAPAGDSSSDVPPLPPYLHPASSLSTRSLDRLLSHLASPAAYRKNHPHASTALSLSLSLSALRRRRSPAALATSFSLALYHQRPDFAARFLADLCRETLLRGRTTRLDGHLSFLLRRLSSVLRPQQKSFEAVPSRRVLAAVAVLARTLDEAWAAALQTEEKPLAAVGELIRLLASFPPAPPAKGFVPARSARARHARRHERVGNMVKEVLRRIVEDVAQREVQVEGPKTTLGGSFYHEKRQQPLTLSILDYNTLISFALLKLQCPELAVLLLERMTESGIRPSPATHNIVFAAFEVGSSSLTNVVKRQMTSPYTLPIFLTHMARTASYEELERIVFTLLPELDYRQSSPDITPTLITDASFLPSSDSSLSPDRPPPLTGRTPYLYTTLLSCVVRSGRIGLAERVFRNARWAAERSREPLEPGGKEREGWVLPPHAYTIMLQLYAGEVKRGKELEGRDAGRAERGHEGEQQSAKADEVGSLASPYVRGWGRHALRVFLLQEHRAKLAQDGGTPPHLDNSFSRFSSSDPSAYARRREHRTLDLPPFLRSEAAPIVAIWELEGGSKGPELESLRRAMASPQAQTALRVLFPATTKRGLPPPTSALLKARDEMRELGRRRWRIGERAAKDEGRARARARGEVGRRREVVRRLVAEEEARRRERKEREEERV